MQLLGSWDGVVAVVMIVNASKLIALPVIFAFAKGNTKEIRHAKRAGAKFRVLSYLHKWQDKGNPAREARRSKIWGPLWPSHREIQRKPRRRRNFVEILTFPYKGNTTENPPEADFFRSLDTFL